MNNKLLERYDLEIEQASTLYYEKKYDQALCHLEIAHVLSQAFALLHTRVHLHMLRIAIIQKNVRDIFVQTAFIVLGFLGSLFGLIVKPNYGRGGVSQNTKPIDSDILELLQ